MDAVIKNFPRADGAAGQSDAKAADIRRPTQAEAEAAVRTLVRWTGDDPDREGLKDTPRRVAKAYREMFGGYGQDPARGAGPHLRGGRRL